MEHRDDWREAVIQKLESEVGMVRTHPSGPLILVALPIVAGFLMRGDNITTFMDQVVFLFIFGLIAVAAVVLGSQKLHLIPGGIEVSKLFRSSKSFQWEEISAVNYSRWLRFVSLRSRGRLIYFNSTDGLAGVNLFVVIAIYRVRGRCSQGLQNELDQFFEIVEQAESEERAESSPP